MIQKFITAILVLFVCTGAFAQFGARGGAGGGMPTGRFYGKVVDAKTNKPIDASSVQLVVSKFDMATRTKKDSVVNGQLTEGNGDFSMENVAFMGDYRLKVTAIGFKTIEQKVSFLTADQQQKVMQLFMGMGAQQGVKDSTKKASPPPNVMEELKKIFGGDMMKMASMADKDLGNIKLEEDAKQLENVTVVGRTPTMTLAIDRKVFNVEKALTAQGQTAVEVMRQIPSVNVDIDGNVTLRNSAPTIFVDGRPTTLTLDQIPADAIQSVEVITNPSAKFDASGGTASILNVVMKKNRKNGYNGSIRAGIDQRGRYNIGGDINLRQKKVNLFLNGQYGQRKSKSSTGIETNYYGNATTLASKITQDANGTTKGAFGFLRTGMDYFIDNRNTITIAGTYVKGQFNNADVNNLRYDTLLKTETGYRNTIGEGEFRNYGGTLSYKRIFTKPGHEWTADVNYNDSKSNNHSDLTNQTYYGGGLPKGNALKQNTQGTSSSAFWVIQTDYSNPLSDKAKIDLGLRAQIRDFSSTNVNSYYNYLTNQYATNDTLNTNYQFTDKVYAAYATFTGKAGNLGYNIGLRAESSNYDGTQIKKTGNTPFSIDYPISLFPSAFLSYKLSDKEDIQFNYTRRINRPNFFQLIPFVDYSDPLNISQGNPGLTPEFTNSFEANYSNQFNTNHSFLASIYYKHTTDLITRYYDTAFNPFTQQTVNRSTYINANGSTSYGLELTSRDNLTKALDVTTNLNFYNSSINSSNIKGSTTADNSRFSFYGKINANYKFGKNSSWTIQANGDYQGKTVQPVGGGGGGRGGGMRGGGGGFMFGGGSQAAGSNGYVNPSYGVDLAIKKEFLKNKAANITLSMNDIFRTKLRDTYTYDTYFNQRSIGRRDPQILRLQFSYRFGKTDINLFKRKNLKGEMEGLNEGMNSGGGQ